MVMILVRVAALAWIVTFGFYAAAVPALAQSNPPLGLNLNGIAYYSPELPFINIVKSGQYFTLTSSGQDTGEEGLLCLDANGYATTMTYVQTAAGSGICTKPAQFTVLNFLFNFSMSAPYYPAGNYDVYYSPGGCTFSYGFDATLVSQNVAAGHDVINVATSSANGIKMQLTTMGSGSNYCQNISVTQSSLTANYKAGAIFNPAFLDVLAPFRAFRFMDWMCTNSNTNAAAGTWAGRPTPTTIFYGSSYSPGNGLAPIACGVPVEVMVSLCNTLNADCWFNMPTLATNDYVTQFATYVAANLHSNLHAYMEYSNETWNFGFQQWQQLINMGAAAGSGVYLQAPAASNGCATGGNSYDCNRSVMGHQTVQFCALWKTAFGSTASQVKCVMAAQAANPYSAQDAFNCPAYVNAPCTSGIDYVAIAPYFGTDAGSTSTPCYNPAWLSQPDGGLTALFTAIETGGNLAGFPCEAPSNESMLAMVSAWEVAYQAIAKMYNVGVVAYESGQAFSSIAYDPQFTNLLVAAQTDPRMGTAYTNYYNTWAANGGGLAMHFDDVSSYGKFGSWGALQNVMSSSPSSPKYNAMVNFLAGAPPPPPPPPSPAHTHDFNADGKSDIAWRDTSNSASSGSVAIWEMNGTQVLNPNATSVAGVSYPLWTIIGLGDFNGDGYADILWRDNTGDLAIWEMMGTQVINSGATFVATITGWSVSGIGDFNGDGKSDVLWTDGSGNYAIWEMNGTQLLNSVATYLAKVSTQWTVVGVGDFNGDGKADILWGDQAGDYAIWEMNGTQIINPSATFVATLSTNWKVLRVGDFNGDGKSDILWTDGNGNYAISEMNGTQIINSNAMFVANVTGWLVAGTGDYNGDGMSDILWTDGNGNYAIWEMNGTTIINSNATYVAKVSTNWAIQLPLGQ
jgi:hypothetical protein